MPKILLNVETPYRISVDNVNVIMNRILKDKRVFLNWPDEHFPTSGFLETVTKRTNDESELSDRFYIEIDIKIDYLWQMFDLKGLREVFRTEWPDARVAC
jgi:hypothetical protein